LGISLVGAFQVELRHHSLARNLRNPSKGFEPFEGWSTLENLIEQYGHMAMITRKYIHPEPLMSETASPAFREQICDDFSALQVMQVQASEHIKALVEDL
jgi:hypothetical protein